MDVNITNELIAGGLVSTAITGWNLYLSSEKNRMVTDIKDLRTWREKYQTEQAEKWLTAAKELSTKTETSLLEQKLTIHLERIEKKLDTLLLSAHEPL